MAPASQMTTTMLQIGDTIPDFTLVDQDGHDFRVADYLGAKSLVIFFYPLDYSPICTLEVIAFREAYSAFMEAGAEIVGISDDSSLRHSQFCDSFTLPFRLLSDPDHRVRNAFGAKGWLGAAPGRTTYVVDPTGTIRDVFISAFRPNQHARRALKIVRQIKQDRAKVFGPVEESGPVLRV